MFSQFITHNVWFKKIGTIRSSVLLLRIVPIFLNQTLLEKIQMYRPRVIEVDIKVLKHEHELYKYITTYKVQFIWVPVIFCLKQLSITVYTENFCVTRKNTDVSNSSFRSWFQSLTYSTTWAQTLKCQTVKKYCKTPVFQTIHCRSKKNMI